MAHRVPCALDDFDSLPMPISVPPTPSPLGLAQRMAIGSSKFTSPVKVRSAPHALMEDLYSSPMPAYSIPATPSPHGATWTTGEREWQADVPTHHADIVSLGCVQAGTGQTVLPLESSVGMPLVLDTMDFDTSGAYQLPPGIFAIPPPPEVPPQLANCADDRSQVPPPPVEPPRFLPDSFATASVPHMDINGDAASESIGFTDSQGFTDSRSSAADWEALAQHLASQLRVTQAAQSLKVKNTFIHDGSQQRSPSLERLLRRGRQAQSCPGSKLPTPRGSCPGSRMTTPRGKGLPNLKELEVASSNASTVDTAELLLDARYPSMVGAAPSLQVAAWTAPPNEQRQLHSPPSEQKSERSAHCLQLQRALNNGKSTAQVLQLESVLSFDDEARVPAFVDDHLGAEFEISFGQSARLGSPELPSIGSLGHHIRRCKPCAFMTRQGCTNGEQCKFCHLCSAGEKKRRRKEKRALIGAAKKLVATEAVTYEC